MAQEDGPSSRKTGATNLGPMRTGEARLLDDVYEASQEGTPLHETIESLQDEIPLAETAADLRELLRTEPDVFYALIEEAFPGVESVPVVEEVVLEESGIFLVRFGLSGQARPVGVRVDSAGRFLALG